MKKIISLLFLFICTTTFAQSNLALNFARGDLFVEAKVLNDTFYPKSAINVSITLSYIKGADLSFNLPSLPVQAGIAIQLDRKTSFGTFLHNGSEYITKTQDITYFFDRPGLNRVPQIPVFISGTIRNKLVSGILNTKQINLKLGQVDKPVSYSALDSSVDVEVDLDSDRRLQKGDSLRYTFTLKASGTSSLYLPERRFRDADDVVYYFKKLNSTDSSNRGSLEAVVKYEITVVYNRAGVFTHKIEPIDFYNISSGEVESLEFNIPTLNIQGLYLSRSTRLGVILLISFIFLVSILYYFNRKVINNFIIYKIKKRKMLQKLVQALDEKNYRMVTRLLYQSLDEFTDGETLLRNFILSRKMSDEDLSNLLSNIYSKDIRNVNHSILLKIYKEFELQCASEEEISLDIN